MVDIHQYDDGDFDAAIETDHVIKAAAGVATDDVVRMDQLPTVANIIHSDAVIANNTIVRGDGGARKIQDSLASVDDSGSINVPAGQGYQVGGTQVVGGQQVAEGDVAAVSAIAAGAGADTIDLANLNIDLGTLVTEINAIKTTLNNLLAKLRTHGLIDT